MKKKKCKRERRIQKQKRVEQRKHGGSGNGNVSADTALLGGMLFKKINRFVPEKLDAPFFSHASTYDGVAEGSELVFTRSAARQLQRMIDWGKQTQRNAVEQQGILLGQVYETPYGFTGVVESVILSEAVGNSVYVESAHSQWSEMDRKMDEENARRKYKLVKVGWWHTHPNMSIFMSGTDRATQSNYFKESWQFAAVLNPQHMKWGAFVGENADECFGCFVNLDIKRQKREQGGKL